MMRRRRLTYPTPLPLLRLMPTPGTATSTASLSAIGCTGSFRDWVHRTFGHVGWKVEK